MTPRQRRLEADYLEIRSKFDGDSQIDVVVSNPPYCTKYQVIYHLPSTRITGDSVYLRDQTVVEFELTAEYPRVQPVVKCFDPVFHPNFGTLNGVSAKVCIADYWSPAQTLASIIIEVGEMLLWSKFNIRSPLNAVAAEYGQEHASEFPLGELECLTKGFAVKVTADSPDFEITATAESTEIQ